MSLHKLIAFVAGCVALPFVAAGQIRITHGPWLTDMSSTGVTVMWKTDKPAMSWVEYGEKKGSTFYDEAHPVVYDTQDGRRRTLDTLHRVRLEGLKPGTEYFYRIYSKETVSFGEYGAMVFGRTAASSANYDGPTHFRTFDPSARTVRFIVMNDIHERPERIKELCAGIDVSKLDFVLLNGDMLSTVENDGQIFSRYLDACCESFAKSVPMVYTRGNHETRGAYADELYKYFPTSTGHFYFSFDVGNVNFLILDCGEDKPDENFEYSGIADYDRYREQEAKWLASEIARQNAEGAAGKTRIVALHVPPMAGSWHGNLHLRQTLLPILNSADVDLMLSGHIHCYRFLEPSDDMHFPNFINDNDSVALVEVTSAPGASDKITITVSGKTSTVLNL